MKIGILGPESSGKTTLAKNLAKIYNCYYISEYAREYLEKKDANYKYTIEDLELIAAAQFRRINKCSKQENYFIDTDIITIQIWAEDKFNHCPKSIHKLTEIQNLDAIILCKPDFPWENDPLREDAYRQNIIFKMYLNLLTLNKLTYLCAEGSHEKRIKDVIYFLERLNLFPPSYSNH